MTHTHFRALWVVLVIGLPLTAMAATPGTIENGSFTSWTGWQRGVAGTPTFAVTPSADSNTFNAGAPSARLGSFTDNGGVGTYRQSRMYQDVIMPLNCTTANLSLYYRPYSTGPGGTTFNYQECTFWVGGNSQTAFILNANSSSFTHYTTSWKQYSGQTVRLLFSVQDDGGGDPVVLWVDDVSLNCITATPTWTPTLTRTPTITRTRTATPTITLTATISPTPTISATITPTVTVTPVLVAPGRAVVFPNPAGGDTVNFQYTLEHPAKVTIDVFNLMGFRVAHLEDPGRPAGGNQVTTWDIRNVAPGVYFYRLALEAPDGRRTEFERKKIVIAR